MKLLIWNSKQVGLLALLTTLVYQPDLIADDFPNRPVRLIVPTAAGSTQDVIARIIQPFLERRFKQPIVIENRPGASTMLGTEAAARSDPDGHTLVLVPTTFTINGALSSHLPFQPERDFAPLAVLVKSSQVLAINAKLPAHNVTEFVTLVRAQPERFNYASAGVATQPFLLMETFSTRAGIKLSHIPYRGGGPAALSVAMGETQVTMLAYAGIRNYVEAGTIRALATGSLSRDPTLPALPTLAESGFPGFEGVQWLGLLAPAGTPPHLIQKLNAEVNRALEDPELIEKLKLQGASPAGGSPEEFRDLISSEIKTWREVATQTGFTPK